MTRRIALFLFSLLLSTTALRGQTPAPVDLPEGVRVDTVLYDPQLSHPVHLYIIRPTDVAGPLPCIMYVPGSAWKQQKMGRGIKYVAPFARRGWVVACVEYRPCSVALFPAQVEDAKTATRYMRANAARYGVDPDNIFAWGTSSGGHTVLLQALTQESTLMDNGHLGEVSCRVNAVVDFYGPSELVKEFRITPQGQLNPDSNGGLLLGDPVEEKRDVALKASPLYYVHPYSVPVFILHGTADKVVPVEQSEWLEARMKECGAPVQSRYIPGAGHGGKGFGEAELWDDIQAFFERNITR